MSAMNSLRSITSGVLLVSSQTSKKSVIPRFACTSLRNGSTMFTKLLRVPASLSSKSCACAAFSIACSIVMNNLRTLILSKALSYDKAVLSPKRMIPEPG